MQYLRQPLMSMRQLGAFSLEKVSDSIFVVKRASKLGIILSEEAAALKYVLHAHYDEIDAANRRAAI